MPIKPRSYLGTLWAAGYTPTAADFSDVWDSFWHKSDDTLSVTWGNVSGKPTTFTPSAHTHLWADITDKPTTFTPSVHTHLWADITDKPTTFTPSAHTHLWADITDKPTTFTPAAHTHTAADVISGVFGAARLASGTLVDGYMIQLVSGIPTWVAAPSGGSGWGLSGSAITSGQFLGTTNAMDLVFKRNSQQVGVFMDTSTSLGRAITSSDAQNQLFGWNHGNYGTAAVLLGNSMSVPGGITRVLGLGNDLTFNHSYATLMSDQSFNTSSDSTHQFKAAYTNGFKFNLSNTSTAFQILTSGKLKAMFIPSYASEAAAISAEAPNTIFKVGNALFITP